MYKATELGHLIASLNSANVILIFAYILLLVAFVYDFSNEFNEGFDWSINYENSCFSNKFSLIEQVSFHSFM